MFFSLLTTSGIVGVEVTLADLLSGDLAEIALEGGNWKGVAIVLLATATFALPLLWRHRLAAFAHALPLLVTLVAFWPLYVQHRRHRQAVEAMGELGAALGEAAAQMNAEIAGPLANLGAAAWVLFATVLYLAFRGIARAFARGPRPPTSSSAS